MNTFSLSHFPLEGKTVLVRVDYNVPSEKNRITDGTKIEATVPTLRFLLEKKCKVVLATHWGRPQGREEAWQVDPLAKYLKLFFPRTRILKLDDCLGKGIAEHIARARPGELIFLENLRFYPEEEQNDFLFGHSLASLAQVYVNDAFGAAHRTAASIDAITHFLPAIPGFLFEKEVRELGWALHPQHPAVWIFGGAKLEKVQLLEQAWKRADHLLVGGALAFSFLKAQGHSLGASQLDAHSVELAQKLLSRRDARKLILPRDVIVVERFAPRAPVRVVPVTDIPSGSMGLDIGPETVRLFEKLLQPARTIVWNGPLGYVEWSAFAQGTKSIARFVTGLSAMSICGGGSTAQALHRFHLAEKFTHVSTGGGAALAFLAGEQLPAVLALEKNYRRFKKMIRTGG